METMRGCLIEQQLLKIKVALKSIAGFDAFLQSISKILSDLVDNSSTEGYKVLMKSAADISLKTSETLELLSILGYQEEEDQYVYIFSDENSIKVAICFHLTRDYLEARNTVASATNDVRKVLRREAKTGQARSLPDLSEQRSSQEEKNDKEMKEAFLLKHMKKEESSETSSYLKMKKNSANFVSTKAGFFYQSSPNTIPRKPKCFLNDFFHKHDTTDKRRTLVRPM